MTDGTKARAKAAREARLRAALRENLKRRKAQARGRTRDEGDVEPVEARPGGADAEADKGKR
jgi:hypothetical protein